MRVTVPRPRERKSAIRAAVLLLALSGATGLRSAAAQTPPPVVPAVTPGAAPVPPTTPGRPPNGVLEGTPVAKVEFVTLDPKQPLRSDPRFLASQVRTTVGQPYNRSVVEQDIRSLGSTERFVTVRADIVPTTDKNVVVRFVVQERPTVERVEVVGNRSKNYEKLYDLLVVHSGSPVDPYLIQQDERGIRELYERDGYYNVRVDVDQNLLDSQRIVRYTIIEGPRSLIKKVVFSGNNNLKSSYLRFKIKTKTNFWFFRKGVLNQDNLDEDVATIQDKYRSLGFLDVRVSHLEEFTADKTGVIVRFVIIEGPQYKLGQIKIVGNNVFKTAELTAQVELKPGDVARRDRIETTQHKLEDIYGHEGFINARVEPSTTYTSAANVVDLTFTITEGNSYQVGRIIVRGNGSVQDRVIRRQIRIYPDQTYDTVLVRKSQDRIKSARLFNDVKITPIGNEPGVRDALTEVQEGQSGRFLIGAGVSTDEGLIGQVSIEQDNFDIANGPKSWDEFFRGQAWKGAGQYFRILLEPGSEYQQYRVTFEEPYLYDSHYSFGNDAYLFSRDRESYQETRVGDIVTFGRRFGDIYQATLAFRAENVRVGDIQPGAAPEEVAYAGDNFLTSIKPGFIRDTTDSRVFPTEGTRTGVSVEQYGALGGDFTFTKVIFQYNYYITLYSDLFDRKTVLALRNEFDFIPAGDSVFFERFYAGGIGSLRGFRFRGVSPHAGQNEDPVGGNFSWLSTAEVNFPVYEEVLRMVAFVDVGDVESDIDIGTIRSDIGFGFRLKIPFFGQLPLALDFAYPTTSAAHDRKRYVQFALGLPF
jgi:outer membrane protein insertion porin family